MCCILKKRYSPYSIADCRIPQLIPFLGSQPAVDVSHKLGGRLPLLSARPAVTFPVCRPVPVSLIGEQRHDECEQNSLPKTVTRQRRGCDLNPGPSAPESSTLTTRLPSHRVLYTAACGRSVVSTGGQLTQRTFSLN